jgi:hypothetical protein
VEAAKVVIAPAYLNAAVAIYTAEVEENEK